MKHKSNQNTGPSIECLTAEERQTIIDELVDIVAARLRNRAEEVWESPADYGGDDLHEVCWQVCGPVVDDLGDCLVNYLEESLEVALQMRGKQTCCRADITPIH